MKINANCRLNGLKIILIPYNREHVPKYHNWMEDEELRQQTASERLSLDEEFKMQESWRNDSDSRHKNILFINEKILFQL